MVDECCFYFRSIDDFCAVIDWFYHVLRNVLLCTNELVHRIRFCWKELTIVEINKSINIISFIQIFSSINGFFRADIYTSVLGSNLPGFSFQRFFSRSLTILNLHQERIGMCIDILFFILRVLSHQLMKVLWHDNVSNAKWISILVSQSAQPIMPDNSPKRTNVIIPKYWILHPWCWFAINPMKCIMSKMYF